MIQTLLEWVVISAILILVLWALFGKRKNTRLCYVRWAVVLVLMIVLACMHFWPVELPTPNEQGQVELNTRFLSVIEGKETLYSPEHEEHMTLDELCAKIYPNAEISDFSVLDLDGDGIQEVILNIGGKYRQWSIILHEQDNEMRGFALYIRWLNTSTLKEDGAFHWSSSAFEGGWGKLRFTEDGYETKYTIWQTNMTYYLDDQAVSQTDYDAAYHLQETVPDVVWYDFTPENLVTAFPI